MLLAWNIHRNHGADYSEGGEEAEWQEEDEFSGCGGDGVVLYYFLNEKYKTWKELKFYSRELKNVI